MQFLTLLSFLIRNGYPEPPVLDSRMITCHGRDLDADTLCMLEAKHGDDTALETLVNRHRKHVFQYVYGITRNGNAAEELTQEVFLRIHRGRNEYEPTAKFTTWLHTIACRLALNWIRDNRKRPVVNPMTKEDQEAAHWEYVDPHLRVDEWLIAESRRAEVRRAINGLPERQRTVLLLHKFEEVDCEQIAGRLGCSHQAVRSLLFRAYTTLRASLAS